MATCLESLGELFSKWIARQKANGESLKTLVMSNDMQAVLRAMEEQCDSKTVVVQQIAAQSKTSKDIHDYCKLAEADMTVHESLCKTYNHPAELKQLKIGSEEARTMNCVSLGQRCACASHHTTMVLTEKHHCITAITEVFSCTGMVTSLVITRVKQTLVVYSRNIAILEMITDAALLPCVLFGCSLCRMFLLVMLISSVAHFVGLT